MKDDYLEVVDEVVMLAFTKGFAMPKKELWNYYAIRHRLNCYGETDNEGRYYLNEAGLRYAMNGCSKGIEDSIERAKKIDNLTIKIQSFSANRQNIAFWLSIIAGIVSLIGITTGCLALYQQLMR